MRHFWKVFFPVSLTLNVSGTFLFRRPSSPPVCFCRYTRGKVVAVGVVVASRLDTGS